MQIERWEGFGSLGADGAIFRQAGHGSLSHPENNSHPSNFAHPYNQSPAAYTCLTDLGGGLPYWGLHRGSVLP